MFGSHCTTIGLGSPALNTPAEIDTSKSTEKSASTPTKSTKETATETEKLECDICKNILANKKSLKKHMRTHSTDRLKCNESECDETFARTDILARHIRLVHKNLKTYVCETCNLAFPDNFQLERHKSSTHKDERHQCSFCEKSYSQKGLLTDHIKKEHKNQ